MDLNQKDLLVILLYLGAVFSIAFSSYFYLKKRFGNRSDHAVKKSSPIEIQYLAGRSVTFVESLFSIIATEVSAMTFLWVPALAYKGNFSFISFYLGAALGRPLIAKYFLPQMYDKGLTVFESLARGIKNYPTLTRRNNNGKTLSSSIYFFCKLFGVSARLYLGAMVLSEFTQINQVASIFLIVFITYLYTILGGLKGVVRTDILQVSVFIVGAIASHHIIAESTGKGWGELFNMSYKAGKFSLIDWAKPWEFLFGIVGGVIYDLAGHGVDQEFTQKLISNRSLRGAQKAIIFSSFLSVFITGLLLSVGAILWAHYQTIPLAADIPTNTIFTHFIKEHFSTPFKGLFLASILAATMSTLDSSLNALSSCFWNDIMPNKNAKFLGVYVKLDNFIICMIISILAHLISFEDSFFKFSLNLVYWTAAPLLSLFLVRLVFFKFIQIEFNIYVVIFTYLSSFIGMALNHFHFHFNAQFSLFFGVIFATLFIWVYSHFMKGKIVG